MRIWDIFTVSSHGDFLGAFGPREINSEMTQSLAQQQEPSDLQPELTSGMTAMLRVWSRLSSIVLFHKAFLDRAFLLSG